MICNKIDSNVNTSWVAKLHQKEHQVQEATNLHLKKKKNPNTIIGSLSFLIYKLQFIMKIK